ncbi:MAG TPA: hypothetical protein VKV27_14360 [Solirubrobacteraceae bacterium]|nr:hypothetical protein [Solirubrobacteraceae bacterium]
MARLCGLCAGACGFACCASSRAITRRIEVPGRAFVLSVLAVGVVAPCMTVVAPCMTAIALATGAFLLGVVSDAPGVGAGANGPGQLISVTTSTAIQLACMLAVSGAAALSTARGLRSVSALSDASAPSAKATVSRTVGERDRGV